MERHTDIHTLMPSRIGFHANRGGRKKCERAHTLQMAWISFFLNTKRFFMVIEKGVTFGFDWDTHNFSFSTTERGSLKQVDDAFFAVRFFFFLVFFFLVSFCVCLLLEKLIRRKCSCQMVPRRFVVVAVRLRMWQNEKRKKQSASLNCVFTQFKWCANDFAVVA